MRELEPVEIDAMMVRNGVGVLSLIDDTQPYGIPMSFGYENETIVLAMQLGMGYGGRKERCLASNPRACLTVYEYEAGPPDQWRSVVVTGTMEPIANGEHEDAFALLADNAEFAPDLTVWGIPYEDVELDLYVFDVATLSGREFSLQPPE